MCPFSFGGGWFKDLSLVLSGLGVSLNSHVGLVPTLVLSSSLVDGSPFGYGVRAVGVLGILCVDLHELFSGMVAPWPFPQMWTR